jgi:hypothetical protein
MNDLPIMTTGLPVAPIASRVNNLRDSEPDPFTFSAERVQNYLNAVGHLLLEYEAGEKKALSSSQVRYLREASTRWVRFARLRLPSDRRAAIETLERLFRLGRVPAAMDGRYAGELVALSTGRFFDGAFEMATRFYLPWLGKRFDAAEQTGDNVLLNSLLMRGLGVLGWPEYRRPNDEPRGTVRAFPFRTQVAMGIEDTDMEVLQIAYADSPNPGLVRRVTDEVVELPGGYILGKAHMRAGKGFKRAAFFGLLPAGR